MAKQIAYTATASNGQTFTRNSHRTYTHACVAKYSEPAYRAMYDKVWDVDMKNYDYLLQIVATKGAIHNSYGTAGDCADRAAKAKAEADQYTDRKAYGEAKRAERLAKHEANIASGHFDVFHLVGFAGRLDLAHKAFSRDGGMMTAPEFLPVAIKQ